MASAHALIHEENGIYGVSFPDFPGCITTARAEDDAIRKASEVLTFHVAGMVEDGEPLPRLRSLTELRSDPEIIEELADAMIALVPFELPAKAVRVNISMDSTLLDAVDRAADAAGQSRSAYLAEAVRERIRRAG
ncbi:MAG: type II toxin-antitoxin system HicB family antitoxin [Bauldia sp.]|nr:type II toxin-antitoxin system HicB family antitoxin [Bauldia sp.]